MEKGPFEECVEILDAQILPWEESQKITEMLRQMYPFTEWGKINWDKIPNKEYLGNDSQKIIPVLKKLLKADFDQTVYVDWSDGDLPVIETNLDLVVDHFDDVTCVSFEKFIFNPHEGYMVEIRPGQNTTVGILPLSQKEIA